MHQARQVSTILTGKKQIQAFVGRSWGTIMKWVAEDEFPAVKLDGVWSSDALLITDWIRKKIKNGKVRKTCQDKKMANMRS
jgi:hypothetical protein